VPRDPISLYISTMVPNSARFAGKHGDGLVTVGGEDRETYQKIFANFEAGAREAGKDPSRMPRMIELGVDYTDDEEKAIEYRKNYWAGTFVPALFTERIYTPKRSEENGKVVGADTIREAVCVSANSQDHIELAQRYIDMGFDHLIFHSAGPDQRAFLKGYGRDVLPRLREALRSKPADYSNSKPAAPDHGFIDEHNP
jgi:coenzyme F420-dependent glucose-6-phosphate dehydrogenase